MSSSSGECSPSWRESPLMASVALISVQERTLSRRRNSSAHRRESSYDVQESSPGLEAEKPLCIDTPITVGGSSFRNSSVMRPLLKVMPPTPDGSEPGRYKVSLHRATVAQPFGIGGRNFDGDNGPVVIIKDDERIGVRRGDQVLRVNGRSVNHVSDIRKLMDSSLLVDLQLQHHEQGLKPSSGCMPSLDFIDDTTCGAEVRLEQQPFGEIVHDMLRLLETSGPVPLDLGSTFMVHIARTSLLQPFDLVFEERPHTREYAKAMFIKRDTPQYGLRAGDQILHINGIAELSPKSAEALLEDATNVYMECHRESLHPSEPILSEATLDLDDIESKPLKRRAGYMGTAEDYASWLSWLGLPGLALCSDEIQARDEHHLDITHAIVEAVEAKTITKVSPRRA